MKKSAWVVVLVPVAFVLGIVVGGSRVKNLQSKEPPPAPQSAFQIPCRITVVSPDGYVRDMRVLQDRQLPLEGNEWGLALVDTSEPGVRTVKHLILGGAEPLAGISR